MIGHETECEQLVGVPLTALMKHEQIFSPIPVINEDVLPIIPPNGEMIHAFLDPVPIRSWHESSTRETPLAVRQVGGSVVRQETLDGVPELENQSLTTSLQISVRNRN